MSRDRFAAPLTLPPTGQDLSGHDLSGHDLSGHDLSGHDLSGHDSGGPGSSGQGFPAFDPMPLTDGLFSPGKPFGRPPAGLEAWPNRLEPLETGELIDRFHIEARIGEGGVATVYRVRHRTLGSAYALKVLRVTSSHVHSHLYSRLLAEGRLQARLQHPNIIRVHDVLEVKGAPALLMDLVDGPSLARWLSGYAPPLSVLEPLFREITAGVAHAHAHGIVHRDLKPGNVLVTPGHRLTARVTDFGIARFLHEGISLEDLTRTGLMLGTPAYMAPEQLRASSEVDARADLFALGILLYELCCGVRPFAAPDLITLLNSIDRAEYVRPEVCRPDLPRRLCNAISACLVASPARRVPDCATLLEMLDERSSWLAFHPLTPAQGRVQEQGQNQERDGGQSQEGEREPEPLREQARLRSQERDGGQSQEKEREPEPLREQARLRSQERERDRGSDQERERDRGSDQERDQERERDQGSDQERDQERGRDQGSDQERDQNRAHMPTQLDTTTGSSALEPASSSPSPAATRGVNRARAGLILMAVLAVTALFAGLEALQARRLAQSLAGQTYAAQLTAEAWRRYETRPAEALALLRASAASATARPGGSRTASAAAATTANGADEALTLDEVERLTRLGAASRVISAGQQVLAVAISPDGELVAAGIMGGEVGVWKRHTGERLFKTDAGVGRMIDSVQFSSDGRLLVVVPERGVFGVGQPVPARALSPRTGQVLYTFAHGDATTHFLLSPDGRFGVTLGHDERVQIWAMNTGAPIHTLPAPGITANPCLAIAPNSALLAVGQGPESIRIYSLADGKEQTTLTVPEVFDNCTVAFSPGSDSLVARWRTGSATWSLNGRLLARGIEGGGLVLDVPTREPLLLENAAGPGLTVHSMPDLATVAAMEGLRAPVLEARFSRGGQQVNAAMGDNQLMSWDSRSGQPLAWKRGHSSRVMSLAVSPREEEQVLLSGSRDGTLRIWENGEIQAKTIALRAPGDAGSALSAMSYEGNLVARLLPPATLRLWDLEHQRELSLDVRLEKNIPTALEFSRSGDTLALASAPSGTLLLGVSPLAELVRHPFPRWLRWLDFSADDRLFAGYSDIPLVQLGETGPRGRAWKIELTTPPYRVAFSQDNSRLYLAGRDGSLMTVDTTIPKMIHSRKVSRAGISVLELLSRPDRAILGDWDGHIFLWDLAGDRLLTQLTGHSDAIIALEVSPDSSTLVSASWDRTIRLWDVRSGRQLRVMDDRAVEPSGLRFSPDGTRLAATFRDGSLRLWDVRSGRLTAILHAHATLLSMAFSKDGTALRALDARDQVYEWPVSPTAIARSTLLETGALTNFRVCPGTFRVVPVTPFPPADTVWASMEYCLTAS